MIQLTKNFKLSEFLYSKTAKDKGIDNTPSVEVIANLTTLATDLLQPLRDLYGKPMSVNSGYRSVELNNAVGGVDTSQHVKGMAADIRCENPLELLKTLKSSKLEFDQAILYPTFLHLSYNENRNREQVLYNKSYKGEKL